MSETRRPQMVRRSGQFRRRHSTSTSTPIVAMIGGLVVVGLNLAPWVGSAFSADERPDPFILALGGALLILTTVQLVMAMRGSQRAQQESSPTLQVSPQARIARVRHHLTATSRLLDELQDDLATRTQVLKQLEADAKHYEHLASLNREQADAIQNLIGRQFNRQQRVSIWQQVLFLVPAFLLGLVVNWLSGPVLSWISHLL